MMYVTSLRLYHYKFDKSQGQGPNGQGQGLTLKAKAKDLIIKAKAKAKDSKFVLKDTSWPRTTTLMQFSKFLQLFRCLKYLTC